MARKRINQTRLMLTTVLMLGICAGIVGLVHTAPDGIYSIMVAVIGGALFTLIPSSIFEWLVHRYIYHRQQAGPLGQIHRIHQREHHFAIFPTWRYTTNGPVRRHPITEPDTSRLYPFGWRNMISKAAHFAFYMIIGSFLILMPAWFLTGNLLFVMSIVLIMAIISDLFVRVHDAIHYPGRFKFVEMQPWYPFIERHHFIHHVDMEANVNFLLPLADWCYGTLRTVLTSAEIAKHGTLADAKAYPVGHSEPAALFAAELRGGRSGAIVQKSFG